MLARWRSHPIKHRVRERQPITDRLEIPSQRLFFDLESEAEMFLASHNIFAGEDGLYNIQTVRSDLTYPEEALPIWTSEVVKNKIGDWTPGHIIWGVESGRVLRSWDERNYQNSSSFDKSGRLVITARNIVAEVTQKLDERQEAEEDNPADEAAREVADEIVNDTVQTELKEVAMESIMTARQINRILNTEGLVQIFQNFRVVPKFFRSQNFV